MDKKILVSKSISKKYNEKLILDNINFEMFSGEILGLLGPSGIGKTTLLNILVGLEKETSGEIINYHNNKIGYVFQEDRLLNWLTLFENIKLIKEDIDEKIIWENLSLVGLKDYYNYFPKELSGGMRQRGSIARALTFAGNIMLFDSIIYNTDRHLGNFGMITDNNTGKILRPAPIFDNGTSIFNLLLKNSIQSIYKNYVSKFEIDFDLLSNIFVDKRHQGGLEKLKNFKFKRHSKYNLSEELLEKAEAFIQSRSRLILNQLEKVEIRN